jgi:hypothetical protein
MLQKAIALAFVLVCASSWSAMAQESCIGQHTATGMDFSGSGSMISEPFSVREGAIFADSNMSAAGAIQLMNAAGDMVLLRNSVDAGPLTEATQVWTAGQYYLVVDFFSDEGDWSVTIEQPVA